VGAFAAKFVELIGEVAKLGARGQGVGHNGISYRNGGGMGAQTKAGRGTGGGIYDAGRLERETHGTAARIQWIRQTYAVRGSRDFTNEWAVF
jgi:hypothetical protein